MLLLFVSTCTKAGIHRQSASMRRKFVTSAKGAPETHRTPLKTEPMRAEPCSNMQQFSGIEPLPRCRILTHMPLEHGPWGPLSLPTERRHSNNAARCMLCCLTTKKAEEMCVECFPHGSFSPDGGRLCRAIKPASHGPQQLLLLNLLSRREGFCKAEASCPSIREEEGPRAASSPSASPTPLLSL